jgi:transcriptional regulator with XRE-family HTH domain
MELRDYLHKNKISQKTLANALGVSQPHVNSLCLNRNRPSYDLMKKIYLFCNGEVTPNDMWKMPLNEKNDTKSENLSVICKCGNVPQIIVRKNNDSTLMCRECFNNIKG